MTKLISTEPFTNNLSSYFAVDGNFGSADVMVVLNTTNWSEEDWTQVEEASDSERAQIALDLTRKN